MVSSRPAPSDERVHEIGCGAGVTAGPVAERFDSASLAMNRSPMTVGRAEGPDVLAITAGKVTGRAGASAGVQVESARTTAWR
jgi:hypothetical protein